MDIFGSSAANLLTDTVGGGNIFYSHEDNDTVDGGDGSDHLSGCIGDDVLWGNWWNIPPAVSETI